MKNYTLEIFNRQGQMKVSWKEEALGNRKKKKRKVALKKRKPIERKVVDLQLTINFKSPAIH